MKKEAILRYIHNNENEFYEFYVEDGIYMFLVTEKIVLCTDFESNTYIETSLNIRKKYFNFITELTYKMVVQNIEKYKYVKWRSLEKNISDNFISKLKNVCEELNIYFE